MTKKDIAIGEFTATWAVWAAGTVWAALRAAAAAAMSSAEAAVASADAAEKAANRADTWAAVIMGSNADKKYLAVNELNAKV